MITNSDISSISNKLNKLEVTEGEFIDLNQNLNNKTLEISAESVKAYILENTVGRFVDDTHTNEIFNCYDKDSNDNYLNFIQNGKYNSVHGYNNKIINSPTSNQHNTIYGAGNKKNNGSYNFIDGQGNTINADSSLIFGSGNTIGNTNGDVPRNTSVLGDSNNINRGESNFIKGSGNYITDSSYSSIIGMASGITGSSCCFIFSESSHIEGSRDSFIIGSGNNIISSQYSFVSGVSNYNGGDSNVISGARNTLQNSNSNILSGEAHNMLDSSFSIFSGSSNRFSNVTKSIVSGYGNNNWKENNSSEYEGNILQSIIEGSNNKINGELRDSIVVGSNNTLKKDSSINSAIILGNYNIIKKATNLTLLATDLYNRTYINDNNFIAILGNPYYLQDYSSRTDYGYSYTAIDDKYLYSRNIVTHGIGYSELFKVDPNETLDIKLNFYKSKDEQLRRFIVYNSNNDTVRVANSNDRVILGVNVLDPAVIANNSDFIDKGRYNKYLDNYDAWTEVEGYDINNDNSNYVMKNKQYDNYINVVLNGTAVVDHDGTAKNNSYVISNDEGKATNSNDYGFPVLKVLDETHVKILLRFTHDPIIWKD